jgi:ABC-type branched-subunit amino acid transport system substrate-binding protein
MSVACHRSEETAASTTTSTADAAPAMAVIHIGALADSTGAQGNPAYAEALNLAASQMNEGLTRAGANLRFSLDVVDSKSSPAVAKSAGLDFVNAKGAKALVADVSADTVAFAKLLYDPASTLAKKVPVTCFQCSSALLNNAEAKDPDPVTEAAYHDAEKWMYRVFQVSSYESSLQVQFALRRGKGGDVNGDGKVKFAIYASNDAFGKSCDIGMRAAAKALIPNSIVSTVWYDPTQNAATYDFHPDAKALMAPDPANKAVPDMVYLAVLGKPSVAMIRAYRDGKYTAPLQSTTAMRRNDYVRDLGDAAEAVEGDSPRLLAGNATSAAFADAFSKAYGHPPEMPCAGAFDAATSLMLAAVQAAAPLTNPADVTPAAIRDTLPKLFDPAGQAVSGTPDGFAQAYAASKAGKAINYSGPSGYLSWDASRNNHPEMVHWVVKNKAFVELEAYECDAVHPMCALDVKAAKDSLKAPLEDLLTGQGPANAPAPPGSAPHK